MAYDEELAGRIRRLVCDEPGMVEKRMFGGLGFLVGGHLAASASGQGGLLLRCDPAETTALLDEPRVARFEMRGRALDGWLHVAPRGGVRRRRVGGTARTIDTRITFRE